MMIKFMNLPQLIYNRFLPCLGFLLIGLSSCKKETDPKTILPKEYLPAYPGSYWDYSDGSRSRVEPVYQLHNYRESPNETGKTELVFVPVIDGQYLYEYSVYQASPIYPLKKLLSTETGKAWEVDENNDVLVYRIAQTLKSFTIKYPGKDSVFNNIIVSVEFLETFNENNWNRKEYYAKNVGLIRVEVNNPYDTLPPVIEKEIRNYFINK